MTKQEAEQYVNGTANIGDDGKLEPSQTRVSTEEPSVTNPDVTETSEAAPSEPQNTTSTEEKQEDSAKETSGSEKPEVSKDKNHTKSKTDKISFAFAKEKAKRRELNARLEAKEKEIANLSERLKKYEGLTLADFKNDQEAYMDYKVNMRADADKVARMNEEVLNERTKFNAEQSAEIADARLHACFPDEAAQERYKSLVAQAETNFAQLHPELGYEKFSDLLLSEEDRSVVQYLQDSDNAPKLIRHFIHKPEAMLRIMSKHNPYLKMVELRNLENRMLQFERIQATRGTAKIAPKKDLPDTGKVVNNNSHNSIDWSKPMTKRQAEEWLRTHR